MFLATMTECQVAQLTLLSVHLPLVVWLSARRPAFLSWQLVVGLGAVVVGWAAACSSVRRRNRALIVRVCLGLCGVAVVSLVRSPEIIPYAVVVVLAAVYDPRIIRRFRREVAEEELAARLQELDRTKDELLSLASHELRTPLTGVLGFARTLTEHAADLDQETLRVVAVSIEDHSRRLARLIDNLVATSQAPVLEIDGRCDLREVTSTVMSELAAGSPHPPRVQVSLRGRLEVHISSDAARRVLLNLMDNAVKFADADTVVRLDARPQGGDVVVDVENVGPPIPADIRERLYEPFVQADSSDSRKAEGLGLGLHVVRRLIEAYGGRVELHDANGLVLFRVRLRPFTGVLVPPSVAATSG